MLAGASGFTTTHRKIRQQSERRVRESQKTAYMCRLFRWIKVPGTRKVQLAQQAGLIVFSVALSISHTSTTHQNPMYYQPRRHQNQRYREMLLLGHHRIPRDLQPGKFIPSMSQTAKTLILQIRLRLTRTSFQ